MTREKMTVHKALCELKTLDARIDKAIKKMPFVFANKHSNSKVSGIDLNEYIKEIKEAYQSANDLMRRRAAIKKAVVISNAETEIVIGDSIYTVAEAIEIKNHAIPMENTLLYKMGSDNARARKIADDNNGETLEQRANNYITSLYANADMKNLSAEVQRVRNEFMESQAYDVVDPIGIVDEIKKLEEKISTFTTEIDAALSVSNATTEIEIEY